MIVEKGRMLEQCFLLVDIRKVPTVTITQKMKNVWAVTQVLYMNFSMFTMNLY